MRKWWRSIVLMAVLAILIVAGCFEAGTHVGRGWLLGQAFYQGRPTSYWHGQIDRWLEGFADPDNARRWLRQTNGLVLFDGDALMIIDRQPTLWTRLYRWFQLEEHADSNDTIPAVLLGDLDAEPVLKELEHEPRYQLLIEHARIIASHRQRILFLKEGAAP